jgi:hypothetical protein
MMSDKMIFKKQFGGPIESSWLFAFKARWLNCELRLLASSCLSLSVRPDGCVSGTTRLPLDRFT